MQGCTHGGWAEGRSLRQASGRRRSDGDGTERRCHTGLPNLRRAQRHCDAVFVRAAAELRG